MSTAAQVLGYVMLGMISIIGLRFLFYFHSFFFHWGRYRRRRGVTDDEIAALEELPFIKIQITTRGSLGTSEVMTRAIANVAALVSERRALYDGLISIEVVTENEGQKLELGDLFDRLRLDGHVIVVPKGYETRNGTQMKARGLHYMVELRRSGFNRKPSQTFVVHYDEESVMEPSELRKLIHYVATTRTKVSEGPIHYPLEYREVSPLCRAMEANRPIGCYECRAVMERGVPLHLHGSNLVIDEEFENDLGWDIGLLDGQPFVAEDYVFGVNAFIKEGDSAFGWHGSVMLEQPPFSVRSAFRQRYRWVFGVLQGLAMVNRMPEFRKLSRRIRWSLIWGTRFRVLTFALGLPTGLVTFLWLTYLVSAVTVGITLVLLPFPAMMWLIACAFLWINSVMIGVWYNVYASPGLTVRERWRESVRVLTVTPLAGVLESSAGAWAVAHWLTAKREVSWVPTPKTKQADKLATAQSSIRR